MISRASSFFFSSILFLYFLIIASQSSAYFSLICDKNISFASFSLNFAISPIFPSSSLLLLARISFSTLSCSSFSTTFSYFS
jgi:hypothetical protein